MESTESLILDEDALNKLAEHKKPIFIFQWLRYLDKALANAQKSEIKEHQKHLVNQLVNLIKSSPGPPHRRLIARSLSTLFNVGDTFLLFDAVNQCNDILKNKDDSPSFLPTKLAAVTCIGAMYEKLGRLMGRSYEDTVYLLLKSLKNAESQFRYEIYQTLGKILNGLGSAATAVHRDVFKALRHGISDRVMLVRCSSSQCLQAMLPHAPFLYTTDLESLFSLCFRALDGSNYEVRCSIAQLLGALIAITQEAPRSVGAKNRLATLDETLNLLASGFLKGGIGFLKGGAGEMIKGTSSVSRETRVGITHAYIVIVSNLGNQWLERNLVIFLTHLLDLLANPKFASSHMDAVYSRRCISFVLRSILGKHLGEKAQLLAIKFLINIINKYINANLPTTESATESNSNVQTDIQLVQHVLICALIEIGCLTESLGTCSAAILNDASIGVVDTVAAVLVHPSPSARLAAAWCLRCIAIAAPYQLTPLIERSLERLETLKSSSEIIYGHSAALAAVLGAACQTPLGIPHCKGKLIFNIAEDLLRSASQNSRLSLQRTQAGWLLISSVMTLGPPVVRGLLPRMLLLWKNSFPRSNKDIESEKARGDAFTWQVTLENRAGALSSMSSFITHCNKLVTEEVVRRLLSPIESAITMLTSLNNIFRNFGPAVKASCAMVRLRLYETLLLLPPNSYDSTYTSLLRLLVAEFTLADNPANTTTSLLRSFCHSDDDIILGSWIQETDHKAIEDQLQPNSSSGSGALEHDITVLFKTLEPNIYCPGPLPLGVSVIDYSCLIYGHIFRFVASKHRLQMLSHFQECIKHAKASRQEAVQMNVLTAILGALKVLGENKASIGPDEVKKSFVSIIMNMLSHNNSIIRCAAAQALGRCCQVVNDGRFVAEMAQVCFDKLKSARDALSRTGHSLALGCLHRYVGSLGSSQHLNTSISILLALSQDSTSPVVQVWALHALTLIADSGGPMYKSYIDASLSQALKLLMTVPLSFCDVHQCIGKLLSAMITTVGPELQANTNSVCATRSSLLIACSIMQEHNDPLVQAEAISCLQQLHLFAPKHVNLSTLVPTLCDVLRSPHLFLRRASIACLHQLSQREAKEVCDHAQIWAKNNKVNDAKQKVTYQPDYGLIGVLFNMLDSEVDEKLLGDIKKIIISLTQSLATENLHLWLSMCKEVLTASDPNSAVSTPEKDVEVENDGEQDDATSFKTGEEPFSHPSIPPKWKTRVFATQILSRVILACENSSAANIHFDLSLARERKSMKYCKEDYLVLHLSDLIRMTFMAATSDSDALRLEGLKALQLVIDKFSKVPEPEFPSHVILEQYQAQVGAALRPAFSPDTPSHVTAIACHVCSAWIGSGVARDLNDLRRVHQLLVSSLAKLQKDSSSRLYNESASTLEKLAILKSWAEVYVVAMSEEDKRKQAKNKENCDSDDENGDSNDVYEIRGNESLLQLVTPELFSLSKNWLAALKDHALLTLPTEFSSQLPHDGGAFYTSDTIDLARPRYRKSWPQILHAAALWLCNNGFEKNELPHNIAENKKDFHLLFGICMEALCNPKSTEPLSYVVVCLQSLLTLLNHPFPRSVIGEDRQLSIELCNVLHRLLLTRETPSCQLLVLDIANLVCQAQAEEIDAQRKKKLKECAPANQKHQCLESALSSIGEGNDKGDIIPGQSVVYALLEVCLCVLVRQLPELSPTLANTPGLASIVSKKNNATLSDESANLIGTALQILCKLPNLCSPAGSVVILPSVLYLVTGVLKESSFKDGDFIFENKPISTVLDCLTALGSSSLTQNPICGQKWIHLLQSTLAKILDLCKTSVDDEPKPDEITTLMAVGIFIMRAPQEVILTPNLQYPCINLFKQSLQSNNDLVQLKCIQTLKDIFQHPQSAISIPYIHSLAPRLVELIGHLSNNISSGLIKLTKIKYDVIMEIIKTLEVLVIIAENDKKIHVLSLYLPILVSLLNENLDHIKGTSYLSMLHSYSLEKLMSIGPTYSQEFRQIIGQVPKLKTKLETAIRNQQNIQRSDHQIQQERNHNQRENPAIKLKTDFSNYTRKN